MRLYHSAQLTGDEQKALCIRLWTAESSTRGSVEALCLDVKKRGDAALREYSKRFDTAEVIDVKVNPSSIEAAQKAVPPFVLAAIDQAARNIRAFHASQIRKEEELETEIGVVCWREQRALETVGLYVPAGSAPLPSTVLMLGIPALLAGCKRIILCSPPKANGLPDPVVLAAAAQIGLHEVYAIGGAQAIAAMAFGTESVPRVDKIFGPGNQYVTEAKRFVASDPEGAAIDLLAGPSELLIIADDTAHARIVAADLLSQAEHDPQSQVVLAVTSDRLAKNVLDEIDRQLMQLPRNAVAAKALETSFVVVVQSLKEAAAFSNLYAPEHLIINVRQPNDLVPLIQNAGSVFLGPFAPVTAGDYASGTNHTLPTGGTARWFSGVSLESFQKLITFQSITRDGLKRLAPTLTTLAGVEGLEAHARAVSIRFDN
ncbi:MAG: histidinol dehydrogenase [Ignavibacteriales bacterium]|nr:histidinol dehydrogenase [Ignavibacteriales bacterium]